MEIQLTLYRCLNKPNTLIKELTEATEIFGTFTGEVNQDLDLINPTIEIEIKNVNGEISPLSYLNYAHIKTFGRFYFITKIEMLESKIARISLHSDVLRNFGGSYWQNAIVEIERTTNPLYYDSMVVDVLLPMNQEPIVILALYDGYNPFTYNLNESDYCFTITYI